MTYRIAQADDLEAIIRVHLESWHTAFSTLYPQAVEQRGDQAQQRRELWQQILADPACHVCVWQDHHGTVQGVAQGGPAKSAWGEPAGTGELHRLYISPAVQGKGIGKNLTRVIAAALMQRGFQRMLVAAWAVNTPARSFYEYLGAELLCVVSQQDGTIDNSQALYCWQDLGAWIEGQPT